MGNIDDGYAGELPSSTQTSVIEYAVAYTYGDCHLLASRERAEQWLALAKEWDARGLKAYSGAHIVTRTTTTTRTAWGEALKTSVPR